MRAVWMSTAESGVSSGAVANVRFGSIADIGPVPGSRHWTAGPGADVAFRSSAPRKTLLARRR